MSLMRIGREDDAYKWVERTLIIEPDDPSVLYNVACFYSQVGEIDQALECRERATLAGMANKSWIRNDSDLGPLRDHALFKQIFQNLAD